MRCCRFPKTYPTIQPLIYNVREPIVGLTKGDLAKLAAVQQQVVKSFKGSEMVMEVRGPLVMPNLQLLTRIRKLVTACQDWIADNVKPSPEVPGSLASQMNQRAEDEERVDTS